MLLLLKRRAPTVRVRRVATVDLKGQTPARHRRNGLLLGMPVALAPMRNVAPLREASSNTTAPVVVPIAVTAFGAVAFQRPTLGASGTVAGSSGVSFRRPLLAGIGSIRGRRIMGIGNFGPGGNVRGRPSTL